MTVAYIGFGSNLGDRLGHLRAALRRLDAEPGIRVLRGSRVYETSPVGYTDQGWFLNAVAEVATELDAPSLLRRLLAIEAELGRERTVRWGPRTVDLDLLLYGDLRLDDPECTVPHPRLEERNFVIVPLAELVPDRRLFGGGTVAGRARAFGGAAGPEMRAYPAGLLPPVVDGEPDVLDQEAVAGALRPGRFGRPWHAAGEVGSTNDWARSLAEEGAPEGTAVAAEVQLAGRGRAGRKWFSPGDWGLWLSVVLRPDAPAADTAELTLVAGIALADAVAATTGRDPVLKWPNDLLLGDRKVAGVLTEGRLTGGVPAYAIVGAGVNVNTPEDAFPPAVRDCAGSLQLATGRPIRRAELAATYLAALEARYHRWRAGGFQALRDEYLARLAWQGETVVVRNPSGTLTGRLLGVDESGRLLVGQDGGSTWTVSSGDVTLRRAGARGGDGVGSH